MNLRNAALLLLFLIILGAAIWRSCTPDPAKNMCAYNFPSYNPDFPPPTGTPPGDIFALSQDYPETYATETVAWTGIDFKTAPVAYAQAVLDYCFEGNIAVDFKVQNNTVRKWYHVPWLHYGPNGREWRRGLTRERNSRPGELHPNQSGPSDTTFSWAVGFYNPAGGYTLRRVWPDCGKNLPDPRACNFPEKTVTFKLLFTSATDAQVPFMTGSKPWTVNTGPPAGPRTDHSMRLLQVDIAVKDSRSPIGWVFGTYIYDGSASGADWWNKLKLVGLSWGNDPTVTSHMTDSGAFTNPDIHESFLNTALIPTAATPVNAARAMHFGLGGRLNGPVDNPISSCTSCHGKAAVLKDTAPDPITNIGRTPRVVPRNVQNPSQMTTLKFNDFFGVNSTAGTDDINYNCFISDIPDGCNDPSIITTFIKTDYSLQVATGIERFYSSIASRAQAFLDAESAAPKR